MNKWSLKSTVVRKYKDRALCLMCLILNQIEKLDMAVMARMEPGVPFST